MKKKVLAIVLALIMSIGAIVPAFADPWTYDITTPALPTADEPLPEFGTPDADWGDIEKVSMEFRKGDAPFTGIPKGGDKLQLNVDMTVSDPSKVSDLMKSKYTWHGMSAWNVVQVTDNVVRFVYYYTVPILTISSVTVDELYGPDAGDTVLDTDAVVTVGKNSYPATVTYTTLQHIGNGGKPWITSVTNVSQIGEGMSLTVKVAVSFPQEILSRLDHPKAVWGDMTSDVGAVDGNTVTFTFDPYIVTKSENKTISLASVSVQAPTAGAAPKNARTPRTVLPGKRAVPAYTVAETVWTPGDEAFEVGTEYSVTVKIAAKDGYRFAAGTTAFINRKSASASWLADGGRTIFAKYDFPKVEPIVIEHIAIEGLDAPNGSDPLDKTASTPT